MEHPLGGDNISSADMEHPSETTTHLWPLRKTRNGWCNMKIFPVVAKSDDGVIRSVRLGPLCVLLLSASLHPYYFIFKLAKVTP
jgi:hypothetical protein